MRFFNYSNNDLDFIARLGFYDVKKSELLKRNGHDIGNRVWERIGDSLTLEFEITQNEDDYIWRKITKMYEDDNDLVPPQFRFDRRGLPFD